MRVSFYDLQRLHASIRSEIDVAIRNVVDGGRFVGGEEVRRFEEEFASVHGALAAAACGSGTDALVLALLALGVGPGDEVVVPAMTFVATAEAVVHAGATPVLADVDQETLLLTRESVTAVRSRHTKAVIPVHLYGHAVPFTDLASWRDEGLVVIEDAAQAHLATWGSDPVGTAGHACCFSFYPGKNLGALGDGGLVLSRDRAVIEEVACRRDHGRRAKHEHVEVGYCSRLDAIQAAVLRAKLSHLPAWTAARRELAGRYAERLGPSLVPWSGGDVHHLLVARVTSRELVRTRLEEEGVGSGVHYPAALTQTPSLLRWSRPALAAERAAAEVVSLPMDPLMETRDVDAVCDAFEAAVSGAGRPG